MGNCVYVFFMNKWLNTNISILPFNPKQKKSVLSVQEELIILRSICNYNTVNQYQFKDIDILCLTSNIDKIIYCSTRVIIIGSNAWRMHKNLVKVINIYKSLKAE